MLPVTVIPLFLQPIFVAGYLKPKNAIEKTEKSVTKNIFHNFLFVFK